MFKALPELSFLNSYLTYYPETGTFISKAKGARVDYQWGTKRKRKVQFTVKGKMYRYAANRLAYYMHYEQDPGEYEVDHINRNPSDNRIENLRLATRSQNSANRGKEHTNTTGYKNVCYRKKTGKFEARASYTIDGKRTYVYLGVFDDPKLAHDAYVEWATNHHPQKGFVCVD